MAGHLIRRRRYRGDLKAASYVVALDNAAEAIDLIKSKLADPSDEVEDLGDVSDALVQALHLIVGEFVRIDSNHLPFENTSEGEQHLCRVLGE